MFNWRTVDTTIYKDSTIEGFFSIVYDVLKFKVMPKEITSEDNYLDNILDTPIFIKKDINKFNTINNFLKRVSLQTLYSAYIFCLIILKKKL